MIVAAIRFPFLIFMSFAFCAVLSGCVSRDIRNIRNMHDFYAFTDRHGATPSCNLPGRQMNMFPGDGGDTLMIGKGRPVYVLDVGDDANGPNLETHDRLVVVRGSPDQFSISREGSALLLCSEDRNISVVVMRHYCSGRDGEGLWNNAVEEITFSSGETWLRDDLYTSYKRQKNYITQELLESYRLPGVSDQEIKNWRVSALSEHLPPPGLAKRHCRRELERFVNSGYDPDQNLPAQVEVPVITSPN